MFVKPEERPYVTADLIRTTSFTATEPALIQLRYARVRLGPLHEFIWVSGIGPRVAAPGLILIDPYPWAAPLEDVRLKAT